MSERIGKQKVLIVDDSVENLKILGESIKDLCQALVARNGEKALKIAASENPPDLILLDIVMPEMDGYEVCRRLQADPETRGIPILFVTSLSDVADETKGLELGAIDYITKPISPTIVRARVKNHLELKRQSDLLEDLSAIDGLTCVATRRRFDETLDREWRRAARSGAPISLIMMDVDFFKEYNDRYGHVAGDECLKLVAKTLQACFSRGSDLLARYGGEEFAAILGGTDGDDAVAAAERALDEIRSLHMEHAHSSAADRVTLSMGVATVAPSHGLSPEALIEAADKMLYSAKNQGRNRIRSCVAQPD